MLDEELGSWFHRPMRLSGQNVVGKLAIAFLGLALAVMVNGCVIVSLHATYLVRVHVTLHEDGKPIANAPVKVQYAQIPGYGVYYVLNVPKPQAAVTDTNGDAIIPLAAFSQYINFFVSWNKFEMTPELIEHGGVSHCVAAWNPPAPDVSLVNLAPPRPRSEPRRGKP